MATVDNMLTKIIFRNKIFLLTYFSILFFNLKKWYTKIPCAIISKIMNERRITLLKNLYIWISNLTPNKIEWTAKKIADKIPNILNL